MLGQIYANTYLMGRYVNDIIIVASADNEHFRTQDATVA